MHGCLGAAGGQSSALSGLVQVRSYGAGGMAMTFSFRGPIPDWLNPETAGHRFLWPPEVPVPTAGRELLDGASATYAYASDNLKHDLEVATETMRALGVPVLKDRKQIIEIIEWIGRDKPYANPERTPAFKSWLKWKKVLDDIQFSIVPLILQDGSLRLFGELNLPGSHPLWIDPLTWTGLDPDPEMPGRFTGCGLVFWKVRLISVSEVDAMCKAHQTTATAAQIPSHTSRRIPQGLDYAASDAPLVQEMRRGIEIGKFRNPTDAARALASQAKGDGQESSKVSRLLGRYSAAFRTEQN